MDFSVALIAFFFFFLPQKPQEHLYETNIRVFLLSKPRVNPGVDQMHLFSSLKNMPAMSFIYYHSSTFNRPNYLDDKFDNFGIQIFFM